MSQLPPGPYLEYVSGGVYAHYGELFVHLANVGNTPAFVQVQVFEDNGSTPAGETDRPKYDSSDGGQFTSPLSPGTLTEYQQETFKEFTYWFIVRTTSPDLIPSVSFVRELRDPDPLDGATAFEYASIQPGDFLVLQRVARPTVEVPPPPTQLNQ